MAALFSTFRTQCHNRPRICSSRIHAKPQAVLIRSNQVRVPYDLKQGQSRVFHKLPSGLSMEVIVQKAVADKELNRRKDNNFEYPSLVFVHGSYHAAWCWAEHWLPFFSASGYDCYAVSLLGQGESDTPAASVAGTLQTHARDIAHFIHQNIRSPPVLLGHSFGGLIIQYYVANLGNDQFLEMENLYPRLKGAVLVCSVPPSGNSGLVWRYLFSKPIAAFKVTRSLAAKAFQSSISLCRETFFSATMEDHIIQRSGCSDIILISTYFDLKMTLGTILCNMIHNMSGQKISLRIDYGDELNHVPQP